ncbi:MAG: SdpI family protein [Cytophagales bacterium]
MMQTSRTNWKEELFIISIATAPFIYLAIVWEQLPANMPVHFNWKGEVDDFTAKSNILLILFSIISITNLLLKFANKIDPKLSNTEIGASFFKIRIIVAMFTSALAADVISASFLDEYQNGNLLIFISGLFFTLFGNYLPKISANYFIGIRTPWTLENATVWKKTHILGGKLLFVGGIAIMAMVWFIPSAYKPFLLLGIIVPVAMVTMAYSYYIYKKEEQKMNLQEFEK